MDDKYILTLDTYAVSKVNCIYTIKCKTIQEAKEKLAELLITGKITMEREGEQQVKIYCALIERKHGKDGYKQIMRSDNGFSWYKETNDYLTKPECFETLDTLLKHGDNAK